VWAMISLQDAVDDLYRIAVAENKRQSPNRLSMLAEMCVEQLAVRGVVGAARELSVPGIGRSKNWDVAWPPKGRVRLGISLKSLLRNIAGTVPNRVDDLAGEMANVQLLSPDTSCSSTQRAVTCGETGLDGLTSFAMLLVGCLAGTLLRGPLVW